MHELMLMRHGKSDWDAGAGDDHSRPLASRGIASAERMGLLLRQMGLVPDLVVSSTAKRSRATAELARITGGWDSRLVLEDRLYGASVRDALEIVAQQDEACERVLLVGHEPTWSMMVRHLTGGRVAMRTATVAEMSLSVSQWAHAPDATATLTTLLQPRHFVS